MPFYYHEWEKLCDTLVTHSKRGFIIGPRLTSLKVNSILSTHASANETASASASARANAKPKRIPVGYVWHTDNKFVCAYLFINNLTNDRKYNFIPYVFPNPVEDLPCYEGPEDPKMRKAQVQCEEEGVIALQSASQKTSP